MSTLYLAVVDTVGIQSYIFASNRLRENIGASHLVYQATKGWLLDSPDAFLPTPHNVGQRKQRLDEGVKGVETGALAAELLYAGGGNTVLLFKKREDAVVFLGRLHERMLTQAPGLEIASIIVDMEWEQSLAQAMNNAFQALAKKKAAQGNILPLQGLSVTAAGRSSGLAANVVVKAPGGSAWMPLSNETVAKWEHNDEAKARLSRDLGVYLQDDYDFPSQFDDLGRSEGEQSYLAVVHADGNGMGKLLLGIIDRYAHAGGSQNREFIQRLRAFSDATTDAGLNATQAVVQQVQSWNESNVVAPAVRGGKKMLSLRPIVYGGDDVTFVCDGRLGLSAAHAFLAAFEKQSIPDVDGNLQPGKAAAGVTIVKVRYPFSRAYQLAESLCHNAKVRFERQVNALDWHRAQSGLFGSLSEIRQAEYQEEWEADGRRPVHSLMMRPISIGDDPVDGWRTWENFRTMLGAFGSDAWPRNKVMELREVLRSGPAGVAKYTETHGRTLPKITFRTTATEYLKNGWHGGRCVYFDPIEMIDQEAIL